VSTQEHCCANGFTVGHEYCLTCRNNHYFGTALLCQRKLLQSRHSTALGHYLSGLQRSPHLPSRLQVLTSFTACMDVPTCAAIFHAVVADHRSGLPHICSQGWGETSTFSIILIRLLTTWFKWTHTKRLTFSTSQKMLQAISRFLGGEYPSSPSLRTHVGAAVSFLRTTSRANGKTLSNAWNARSLKSVYCPNQQYHVVACWLFSLWHFGRLPHTSIKTHRNSIHWSVFGRWDRTDLILSVVSKKFRSMTEKRLKKEIRSLGCRAIAVHCRRHLFGETTSGHVGQRQRRWGHRRTRTWFLLFAWFSKALLLTATPKPCISAALDARPCFAFAPLN